MAEPQLIVIDQSRLDRIEEMLREALKRPEPPKREWGTVSEAARHYRVTDSTVRRWISDGRVEARGVGKARRVRLD
ncbi:excisionase family DNA binding protein [Rhodovulum sulfidophilum]|uniref:helix-turn-helix domain-containing protein n=2 Tax=Rhodovulum sulfidophilum TaxID=35806 RepID=UPI0005AA3F36|nr:helix-turn-helix domain-containing protein [Rhodovulum sulfidophilum]ANB33268.1 hypothetical protein A6W98_03755 [Rhodovulum sulfidophilum DSM 1374]ANB37116.1 hypothetical protein A6024_03740 [Rhodovulum sulfidophilum]MCW2305199.1 excisionase family DNA binding protein [Rhodovulum sulfidophilum]